MGENFRCLAFCAVTINDDGFFPTLDNGESRICLLRRSFSLTALIQEKERGTSERARWVKVLAVKPDDLGSILRPHVVERHSF